MSIYLIVTIDTECDKGPNWKIKHPFSFNNISEGVPKTLHPLFDTYKIKPTYLLSPEVLENDDCVNLFKSYGNSIELGTHLHSEFIEPNPNWAAEETSAFQKDFPLDVEYKKLSNLTVLFKSKFGYFPESFRAGRFGLSQYTLTFLEELGYSVDSSITPYLWWWRRKGEGINFLGAPYQPYFPSSRDFRKKGKMSILEVPLGIVNPFWEKFPNYILRRINPINRTQTIFINTFFRNNLRSFWLRPTFSSVEQMIFVTNWIIKNARKKRPVLNMMFHSNETTAGTSPYNLNENDVKNFFDKLRKYFTVLFSKFDVQSIALSEAVKVI